MQLNESIVHVWIVTQPLMEMSIVERTTISLHTITIHMRSLVGVPLQKYFHI